MAFVESTRLCAHSQNPVSMIIVKRNMMKILTTSKINKKQKITVSDADGKLVVIRGGEKPEVSSFFFFPFCKEKFFVFIF
jgi:hypothetical protein